MVICTGLLEKIQKFQEEGALWGSLSHHAVNTWEPVLRKYSSFEDQLKGEAIESKVEAVDANEANGIKAKKRISEAAAWSQLQESVRNQRYDLDQLEHEDGLNISDKWDGSSVSLSLDMSVSLDKEDTKRERLQNNNQNKLSNALFESHHPGTDVDIYDYILEATSSLPYVDSFLLHTLLRCQSTTGKTSDNNILLAMVLWRRVAMIVCCVSFSNVQWDYIPKLYTDDTMYDFCDVHSHSDSNSVASDDKKKKAVGGSEDKASVTSIRTYGLTCRPVTPLAELNRRIDWLTDVPQLPLSKIQVCCIECSNIAVNIFIHNIDES